MNMPATWMHGHPPILVLHANARRGVEGLFSLVAEAAPDGGDGFLERDEAFELFGFDQQRQVARSPCLTALPLPRAGR
jgi:hypothetical protein